MNTQTNKVSLVCLYLTSSLNQWWLYFLAIDMSCHLINEITSLENDVIDLTHSISLARWSFSLLLLLSSWLTHVPLTMRLCNSRIPEEHFVCYQTSQHNWVIIKVLYRCLRWYLLSWHRSRLGFVTPSIGEVTLGPLGNAHHYKPCKQCDEWVSYRMMHYGPSKETCR